MSEDFKAEIERLRAENESLKNTKSTDGSLSMKVSEKGALSIYGMGRFPVTLYKEQWLKLLGIADQIKKYIESKNCQHWFRRLPHCTGRRTFWYSVRRPPFSAISPPRCGGRRARGFARRARPDCIPSEVS
jgi:hypothetical protein